MTIFAGAKWNKTEHFDTKEKEENAAPGFGFE